MRRLKEIWKLLKETAKAWSDDQAQRLGASLAFYTVLSIPPLFFIIFFIVGLWLGSDSGAYARAQIFDQVKDLIGEQGTMALETILTSPRFQAHGIIATAIAVGSLILTATGVFLELQSALNTIWGVEPRPGQNLTAFIKNRLLSFAMILVVGFLLLVSLVVSAGLAAVEKYFSDRMPGGAVAWEIVNGLVSFGVITLLFAMMYKILPDAKTAWRDVWVGAALTAGLFTAGKFAIGLYLGKSAVSSGYGAAGSAVIILLWVYYSAQILFFGAEFTQVYACRYGRRIEPASHAQWSSKAPKNVNGTGVPTRPEREHRIVNVSERIHP